MGVYSALDSSYSSQSSEGSRPVSSSKEKSTPSELSTDPWGSKASTTNITAQSPEAWRSDRRQAWPSPWRGLSCWSCPHMAFLGARTRSELLSFTRTRGPHTPNLISLNHVPKTPPPNTITLALGFIRRILGHNIQSTDSTCLWHTLPPRPCLLPVPGGDVKW